jgi:predicted dehydrogenase
MNMNDAVTNEYNRRDFLKGTSFAAMMTLMGAIPIRAAEETKPADGATTYKAVEDPLNFAVIGCGKWGREIIQTLGRRPNAPIVGICDTYKPFLNRCKDMAPKAEPCTDYKQLLAKKEVQAVVVATPSHLHKEIVIDALKAGKHVYCEAPMATTMEDARAIAQAAKAAVKVNFQVGLQNRSDPQLFHLGNFIRTGVMGKNAKVRSQWHKKQMWRVASPNPDREVEANWRLNKELSLGLIGEIGIHQIDLACWYLLGRPKAVTGFNSLIQWKEDGREVPDTVQAVFEYPEGVIHNQELTIADSFDAEYDVYYGSDSAIMVRDRHAWMFKESDAQLLGWEVYARKETFYKESGIVLGADATKLDPGKKPATTPTPGQPAAQSSPPPQDETALSFSLQRFLTNSLLVGTGVEDFIASFGDKDLKALQEYLNGLAKTRQPAATWKEGYESAVIAMKTNEAILKKQRLVFAKEWFEIA